MSTNSRRRDWGTASNLWMISQRHTRFSSLRRSNAINTTLTTLTRLVTPPPAYSRHSAGWYIVEPEYPPPYQAQADNNTSIAGIRAPVATRDYYDDLESGMRRQEPGGVDIHRDLPVLDAVFSSPIAISTTGCASSCLS